MQDLDRLAHDISNRGIDSYDHAVRHLADQAFRLGISPAVAAVLADPHAPSVARERAFARVAMAMRSRHSLGIVA